MGGRNSEDVKDGDGKASGNFDYTKPKHSEVAAPSHLTGMRVFHFMITYRYRCHARKRENITSHMNDCRSGACLG